MSKQISTLRQVAVSGAANHYSVSLVSVFALFAALRCAICSMSPLCRLERTQAVRGLSALYSELLGEAVAPRFTLHLLHVQLSGMLLVLLGGSGLAVQAAVAAWFVLALYGCRRHAARRVAGA